MTILSLNYKKYIEWYLYLILGLKYNDQKCYDMFEGLYHDKNNLYQALLQQPVESDLIKKKKSENIVYYDKNKLVKDNIEMDEFVLTPKIISDLIKTFISAKEFESIEQPNPNDNIENYLKSIDFNIDINEISEIINLIAL
jgi:hypothetical protein